MKDFLGQTLQEGDFLVYPGGGNKSAEYGMILLRVIEPSPDSVKVERLDMDYNSKPFKVVRKRSTIKSGTKLVKVEVPAKMRAVFDQAEANVKLVGEWIHGTKTLDW